MKNTMNTLAGHPIRLASKRSGLSPHLIRMWERRYGAVNPNRTESGHRLYSDEDIERLVLLKKATGAGESIGMIARLPKSELEKLVGADSTPVSSRSSQQADIDISTQAASTIDEAIQAIREFDSVKLMSVLLEASSLLSRQTLVEKVLDPLLSRIGNMWESGEFRVVHEHMSSAVIRSLLGNMLTQSRTTTDAPLIICTTPAGTTHELGALMVAVIATTLGWEAKYLGPDIPSDEIAGAVRMDNADAVALSITYPVDSAGVVNEIRMLGRLLPDDVAVLAGGRASSGYQQVLDEIGAIRVTDHADLHAKLKRIRANPKR